MKNLLFIFLIILPLWLINSNAQTIDQTNKPKGTDTTKSHEMDEYTVMKTGSIVPDFALTTIDGLKIQLSELKGKTIFLNFFTLSCPMCMKELPLLEKEIWPKYKNRPDIIMLAIGREEPVEKLIAFRGKKKLTIPIASDPNRLVYALFAKQYVPRNIVIDKTGKLVLTEVGFTEDKAGELFKEIENELNK